MRILFKTAGYAIVSLLLASCSGNVRISGTVEGVSDDSLEVRLLDVNHYKVLDTIVTDKDGNYTYRMEIKKGRPEFVYVFRNGKKMASFLLDAGDKVKSVSDTSGNFTVSGSSESELLCRVEKEYSDFMSDFAALSSKYSAMSPSSDEAKELRREMAGLYTDYYRSRVKYILENPHSLTVVPVLYQTLENGMPVFAQETDAIHFRNLSDSLSVTYPDSKYVKSLKSEAKRRSDLLALKVRIENAPQLNFPELELPDINSNKVKLSGVTSKVVLLHFWSASDPAQKMFNLDVLKPIYEKYAPKGLEIYQVAVDTDKAAWARTVKDQGLEWFNVCDGLGSASPAVSLYNLNRLPVTFVISDGMLTEDRISDEKSLRRLLDRLLK